MAKQERRVVVEPARERGRRGNGMVLVRYGLPAALVIADVPEDEENQRQS